MGKKKPAETTAATNQEATGQLIEVLQSLTQEVETLTQQVGTLTNHAQVLTEAIDDVRAEMEWAIKNLARPAWAPTQAMESIPHDPLAQDIGKQINQDKPENLPPEETVPSIAKEAKPIRELWD